MPGKKPPRTKVVSMRLAEEQTEYLARAGRREKRTPSQVAGRLVEEAMREERHPLIEFRDLSGIGLGRQAIIRGSRLKVWMMVEQFRLGTTPEEQAEALGVPVEWMHAAKAYGDEFSDEIDEEIAENQTAAEMLRTLPGFVDTGARASSS